MTLQRVSADIPEVIKAAASSALGIIALIVIVVGLICFIFFRKESARIKVGIFVVVFLGAALFIYVLVNKIPATDGGGGPGTKNASATPAPTPKTNITITIVDATLRKAIERLARSDNYTVDYDGCPKAFLDSIINKDSLTGPDTADLIKQLQYRVKNDHSRITYTVAASKERAVYELTCKS